MFLFVRKNWISCGSTIIIYIIINRVLRYWEFQKLIGRNITELAHIILFPTALAGSLFRLKTNVCLFTYHWTSRTNWHKRHGTLYLWIAFWIGLASIMGVIEVSRVTARRGHWKLRDRTEAKKEPQKERRLKMLLVKWPHMIISDLGWWMILIDDSLYQWHDAIGKQYNLAQGKRASNKIIISHFGSSIISTKEKLQIILIHFITFTHFYKKPSNDV